jgi:hypothetical protein
MGDWNLFFATTAGSAATLVGLLFVATQLHLGVFSDPKNRWAALAQSTLTILATAFALSLSFLIPALNTHVRGEIIFAGAAFAIWRGIRIWWPVFRLRDRDRRHLFVQSFWLLLLPFVVYVYLMIGGVGLLRGDTTAIYDVGGALLSMFVLALRNTWRLVVNVEQEEPVIASKDSPNPTGQHGSARPGMTKE